MQHYIHLLEQKNNEIEYSPFKSLPSPSFNKHGIRTENKKTIDLLVLNPVSIL